jgi:signal recognition particle receptor subunit beta
VVDSSSFIKKSKDVAEFLYDVLFESNRSVPILIACHKQDLERVEHSDVIFTLAFLFQSTEVYFCFI